MQTGISQYASHSCAHWLQQQTAEPVSDCWACAPPSSLCGTAAGSFLQVLTAVKERVEAAEKTIASWSEEKPWITEEETKSASEKVCCLLWVW